METNDYTLEQLRSEYEILKKMVENQEIVNDKLLRDTMKSKVKNIRNNIGISVACGVFVVLSAPIVFHYNPVIQASWWFVAATELLMTLCLYMNWKFNHEVQSSDLGNCDLLTFSKKVRKMKENYKNWIIWGLSLALVWGGWLCLEVWNRSTDHKLSIAMITGLIIGLIAGGICGYRIHRKIIRTCDEIIGQIEDEGNEKGYDDYEK